MLALIPTLVTDSEYLQTSAEFWSGHCTNILNNSALFDCDPEISVADTFWLKAEFSDEEKKSVPAWGRSQSIELLRDQE